MHTCRCVSTSVKVREGTGADPGFREGGGGGGGGGLKIIFTMGEGTGGRAPVWSTFLLLHLFTCSMKMNVLLTVILF